MHDVAIFCFRQEEQRDEEAHRRDHNRIPQAGIDIPGRRHDRKNPQNPSGTEIQRQLTTWIGRVPPAEEGTVNVSSLQ